MLSKSLSQAAAHLQQQQTGSGPSGPVLAPQSQTSEQIRQMENTVIDFCSTWLGGIEGSIRSILEECRKTSALAVDAQNAAKAAADAATVAAAAAAAAAAAPPLPLPPPAVRFESKGCQTVQTMLATSNAATQADIQLPPKAMPAAPAWQGSQVAEWHIQAPGELLLWPAAGTYW